ncbi:MAG: hypothetical protein U0841_28575 [Chloroflexia bacterium]
MEMQGAVALVTGGTGGLGEAIATRWRRRGARSPSSIARSRQAQALADDLATYHGRRELRWSPISPTPATFPGLLAEIEGHSGGSTSSSTTPPPTAGSPTPTSTRSRPNCGMNCSGAT